MRCPGAALPCPALGCKVCITDDRSAAKIDRSAGPVLSSTFGKLQSMEQWMLLLVGVVVAAATLLLQRSSTKQHLRLPPGPRGVPVFGNLFQFAASKRRHADFYKLAETYGPIMWLRLGSQNAVMVQSPALAAEILKHQDTTFCSRPPSGYGPGVIFNNGKDVGFAPYGPHWRFMRKLMNAELLSSKRIRDFQHVRVEELGRMVESIRRHVGQPVDLGFLLRALNLNNVTRTGMSMVAVDYEMQNPQNKAAAADAEVGTTDHSGQDTLKKVSQDHELIAVVREAISYLGVQGIGDVVPWLSFLDNFLLPKSRIQETHRLLNQFFLRVIQEHRQYRSANPGAKPRDFLDVLLSVSSSSDGESSTITDDVIAAQLCDMIFAGTDTSAVTVEWAMTELLRHPEEMEQAVQELDRVVGASRAVTEADVADLPFLQAVVKETLRLHPSAPFLIPHYSTQDATVGGYHVPANTTVLVNVWGIARDPAYWPNPDLFQPGRFLGGSQQADVDLLGHHFQLLPFGSGKRICPGLTLGLAMVYLSLATLLQTFTWSLPPGVLRPEDVDITEVQGLGIYKAVSLNPIPRHRIAIGV